MKQSTQLAIVQIVPVTAADDLSIDAREGRDGAIHVGVAQYRILVRVLRGLTGRLQGVRDRPRGDPQRLIASDRGHPGLWALGRLAAVLTAPGTNGGLLGRVLSPA
jgi:hypothetical protein